MARLAIYLLLCCAGALAQPLHLVRVSAIPRGGGYYSEIAIADMDRDGHVDASFMTGVPQQWHIWTGDGHNGFFCALAETSVGNRPGIWPGGYVPYDAGDTDRDGKGELVGLNYDFVDSIGTCWNISEIVESPFAHSLPTRRAWYVRLDYQCVEGAIGYIEPALDLDSLTDLVVSQGNDNMDSSYGIRVYENGGDDSMAFIWKSQRGIPTTIATSDFDLDGRAEMVTCDYVTVWGAECRGDDDYWVPSWRNDLPVSNGTDVFAGRDVDRNGMPEFYVSCARWSGLDWMFYLYGYEATGDNTYERFLVDSASGSGWAWSSCCGDLDGDGYDELAWSLGNRVYVYRSSGPGQYERVFSWFMHADTKTAIADMNNDGYNELVLSAGTTDILEVEAIRVLSPNGGESLVPGETCRVRWQLFTPPQCDSVSLFLRRGSTWALDTIAHGLPPGDSVFDWVVPDVTADSARLVAIAYGPGWKYDESDSTFAIAGVGIEETPSVQWRDLRLSVSPNPTRNQAAVRFELPAAANVEISVLDIAGRSVARLYSGRAGAGRHEVAWNRTDAAGRTVADGVYFVRLEAGTERQVTKVVLEHE